MPGCSLKHFDAHNDQVYRIACLNPRPFADIQGSGISGNNLAAPVPRGWLQTSSNGMKAVHSCFLTGGQGFTDSEVVNGIQQVFISVKEPKLTNIV